MTTTADRPDRPSRSRTQEDAACTIEFSSLTRSTTHDLGELSRRMLVRLKTTIEGEVIPRLMLAFDAQSGPPTRATGSGPALAGNIEELIELLISHDAYVAGRYVAALREKGVPLSALYLDLLAPAARRLGEMWEDDEVSFTDVTIGVCRMHQVMLEFSRCFDAKESPSGDRNALIVPVPGEQHTFGLFILIEFLRRDGWNCWTGTPANSRELISLTSEHDFDVIGLSASTSEHVATAEEQIVELRRQRCTQAATIIAGGRPFIEDPTLALRIGADATASDGREAVRIINRLAGAGRNQPGV